MLDRLSHLKNIDKWVEAGLIDADTAERIRVYESSQQGTQGLRWSVLLAMAFGGLLLGAGILLFVAAHWDALSPTMRFGLILTLVAFFHLSAACVAERLPALATTLHGIGTISLGAGIFLCGQIFNLQEHWPSGVMLWALGALIAWGILRDWVQLGLAAILIPFWLGSEWIEFAQNTEMNVKLLMLALLMLAISYFTSVTSTKETPERKVLMWIGGISLLPLAMIVPNFENSNQNILIGALFAVVLPLGLSWWLRGKEAWINMVAAIWVILLGYVHIKYTQHEIDPYLLWGLGSLLLTVSGVIDSRTERVNLGITAFAITVLAFYFSSIMNQLDRSLGLIILGVLFVLGGLLLEKTRRWLVARIRSDKT